MCTRWPYKCINSSVDHCAVVWPRSRAQLGMGLVSPLTAASSDIKVRHGMQLIPPARGIPANLLALENPLERLSNPSSLLPGLLLLPHLGAAPPLLGASVLSKWALLQGALGQERQSQSQKKRGRATRTVTECL